MIYKYKAKKGPENLVEGKISAQSEKEAVEKITQMGYVPVYIQEETQKTKQSSTFNLSFGRVRSQDITIVSSQLASLLKSGVPFLNAINIIAEQSENPNLKATLKGIHNTVKEGADFSTALSQYPQVFSSLYLAMVRTGENSGQLPEILLKIAEYRRKQEEMMSRFRMAMAYPILMVIVGLGTIIFMLTFVIPRLTRLYSNMGQILPLPTRILVTLSDSLRHWWFWIIIIIVIIATLIRRQEKTEAGKLSISIFKLRLPIFGKLILKSELGRFCRTLELLIKSGVPILRAIQISIPVLGNEVIKLKLRQSYKDLEQGGSFGLSLKDSKVIPVFMSNLIIVGEQSGRLYEALAEVAGSYERDTDEAIKTMSSLLEPIMVLVMGLIVGFIVVAMLLPIFEINVIVR
jgi:type II secretory pathway component PulF